MKQYVQLIRDVVGILCILAAVFCILLSEGLIDNGQDSDVFASLNRKVYAIPPIDPLGDDFILNAGSAEELKQLPGIGEVLALRIIQYREKYGSFPMIEGLVAVEGIGTKKMQAIREYLIESGQYVPPIAEVSSD